MMKNPLYYGLSKAEYSECHTKIENHTISIDQVLAWIGFIGMTVLFFISLFFDQLYSFKKVYCVFSVIFLVLLLCTRKKQKRHAALLLYIICCACSMFGIFLALSYPSEKPMVVHLIFVVLPLLFVDLPVHVLAYTFCVATVYILIVMQFMDTHLRFPEIYNTVVLFFGTNIMHWLVNRDRCLGFLAQIKRDEAIAELQQAQDELLCISVTDALTGLKNRRKLFQTFSSIQLAQTEPPDGTFMIDIDHFKALNDQYGHAVGDRFLQQFGSMLLQIEKAENICIYRYGGEEFVALIWRSNQEALGRLAEKIRLATTEIDVGQTNCTTASIGVVCCDDTNILNYERWVNRADVAAYEAKRQGRNRSVCWNDLEPGLKDETF